jgi:hypothetical protein
VEPPLREGTRILYQSGLEQGADAWVPIGLVGESALGQGVSIQDGVVVDALIGCGDSGAEGFYDVLEKEMEGDSSGMGGELILDC